MGGASGILTRAQSFFGARIWRPSPDLPWFRAAAYRAIRIGYSAGRGFFENRLMVRAAALTYYSVLSIVPFLAFAFALLKGFGAYQSFVDGTLRPYVRLTFAANPALFESMDRILRFVDRTDVSRLGTLALVFLLYTSVSLISSVEEALNDVFAARASRSFLRQLTDYTTLLVTAPILLVVATTLATAAQSSRFVAFLRSSLGLGPVIDFVVGIAPVLAVGLALFAVYVILPNVRIRPLSALLGAAVAALLWQGALVLHVRSQLGVARYNALYSGLGAIPIFLVWTYVSWMVVLIGAQLAASHQDEHLASQRFRARQADQSTRETIALALGAQIARDFLDGVRRSATGHATRLELPLQLVEEVLEALVRAGLVARAAADREIMLLPGRDLDEITAEDLRQALRRDPGARELRDQLAERLGPELRRVVAALDRGRGPAHQLTLRELAAPLGAPTRPGDGDGDGDGAGAGEEEPDAKGPGLSP